MASRSRVVVAGRVQGVGFRYWAVREAARSGVSGFVRNLPDGRVEAEVEGEAAAVERMVDRLRHGPPGAAVTGVEVAGVEPTGEEGFHIVT